MRLDRAGEDPAVETARRLQLEGWGPGKEGCAGRQAQGDISGHSGQGIVLLSREGKGGCYSNLRLSSFSKHTPNHVHIHV